MSERSHKLRIILSWLPWACFLAIGALVVLFGQFQVASADDYSALVRFQAWNGPVEYVEALYVTLTGRIFSSAVLGLVLRSFEIMPIVSSVVALCFVLTGPLLMLSLGVRSEPDVLRRLGTCWREARGQVGLFMLVTSVGLMLGFERFFSQCVYWPVGGIVYGLSTFVSLVWFFGFILMLNGAWRPASAAGRILWLLFSVLVGTAHEQISAALICLGCTGLFAHLVRSPEQGTWKSRIKQLPREAWISLLFFVIGTAILSAAPGNFQRAAMVPNCFPTDWHSLVESVRQVAGLFVMLVASPAMFGFLAGMVLGAALGDDSTFADIGVTFRRGVSSLLAAVLSAAPMILAVKLDWIRTNYVPALFVYGAAFLAGFATVRWLRRTFPGMRPATRSAAVVVLAGMCIVSVNSFVMQIGPAMLFHNEVMLRHYALLERGRQKRRHGETVYISPLQHTPPPFLNYIDVKADPHYYANKRVATFYGIEKILLRQPVEIGRHDVPPPAL